MPHLSILLLGPFQATLDGAPVTDFVSDKARALLAYLAVEADRPHRRESLAGLLWPDFPESAARSSLRTALVNVRQLIGDPGASPPFLRVTRQTVQFSQSDNAVVDVSRFTSLLEASLPQHAGEPERPPSVQHLEEAVALCQGDFLEGFSLADSVLFEEWVLLEREQLQRQALTALHRLAAHYETAGEPRRALQHAWRAVDLDPWPGAGQRQLMRLLALNGRREAALAQYQAYRQLLAEDLGVEPSAATRELYDLLSGGEWPADASISGAILDREVVAADPCPYRGLAAFREEDAPFFFGREGFVEQLAEAVKKRSMVAVIVGSSGCGKSSTVFAGLLPRLRYEGGWLITGFRPGRWPFRAQASALLPFLEPGEELHGGELALKRAVEKVLESNPGANRLLLVVDQFEELYSLCPEPEMRRRFLNELLAAVAFGQERRPAPFVLLLTLRADFMGQALAHRPFADALQNASLLLGPMTREELCAAIERPALNQGAVFETGLVERILDDVGEEPGGLPLLEFALTLLWEQQSYGWLTHAGYEQIGRVEGAVARYADEEYGNLDKGSQESARKVFVQLVRPGEGTEDTRRVASRGELGEANWQLVQHLADRRLVVTGRDPTGQETAELVHEALMRGWGQLQEWLGMDRAFRIWQERLRATLRSWQASERDEDALLRGAPLAEAESWLAERGSELSDAELSFIQAAIALRDRRKTEREIRRRRELEAAQKLAAVESQRAEERAHSATRLRRRAVYLALALVMTLIAASVAVLLWNQSANLAAEKAVIASTAQVASTRALAEGSAAQTSEALEAAQRATAQVASTEAVGERAVAETARALEAAQKATAQAEAAARATAEAEALQEREEALRQASIGLAAEVELQLLGPRPERAVLLALEALENYPYTWQAENALSQAVLESKLLLDLRHEGWANYASVSPDETRIATASDDYRARVWDLATGELLFVLEGHGDWVNRVYWSPDGDRLLTTGNDGTARVWDGFSGEELTLLIGHGGYYAEWSPDGTHILSYRETENTATVWDAATGARLLTLSGHAGRVYAFNGWSPRGARIATTSQDGTAKVWDAVTGEELLTLSGHDGTVFRAEFSPDGSSIATSGLDGTARVWDANSGEHLLTLPGHTTAPRAQWSPSGDRILSVSLGLARVWDAETGETLHLLTMRGDGYAAWSPDGSLIATGGGDGEIKLWDSVTGTELLDFRGHSTEIGELGWFPSGDRIWTVSGDGSAKIWKVSEALLSVGCQPSCPPSPWGGWYSNAAWSPSGEQVAGGYADGTVVVWDVLTGAELGRMQIRQEGDSELSAITSVEWSPTGELILGASTDGGTTVWDADSGVERLRVSGHEGWVQGAIWSPDGSRFVTYARDGAAKVWDAASGELLVTFIEHNPFSASWSPDGRRIVTADLLGGSNSAKIWDPSSGAVLLDLFPADFESAVPAVAWSPDGTRIFTLSEDQVGRVWDAATGEQVLSFTGLSGADCAMWSSSGNRVLASGLGGVAKVWDANNGNQVATYNIGTQGTASWSPDGMLIAINDFDGNLKVYPAWQTLDELIAYAKECCLVRELTPEERAQFGLPLR
jgi:WD40 repeat protein/DNA-binding SARP family transcriptional activator